MAALTVHGQYFGDILGDSIRAQVAAQLSSTNGLGDRIRAQVAHDLIPAQNNLYHSFGDLDTLGERISQDVNRQLEPVHAIPLNMNMKNGVGGTTIVKYLPQGKQFIKKQSATWSCSGSIDASNGECHGRLTRFDISNNSPKSDWCYVNTYNIINDHICLSTGSMYVSSVNGQTTCSSNTDPFIFLSLKEFKDMCINLADSVEYTYIPDIRDPNHVAIPNTNRYVKCDVSRPNYCVFTEKNPIMNSYGGSGGSITIQNGQSIIYSG